MVRKKLKKLAGKAGKLAAKGTKAVKKLAVHAKSAGEEFKKGYEKEMKRKK